METKRQKHGFLPGNGIALITPVRANHRQYLFANRRACSKQRFNEAGRKSMRHGIG